MSDPSSEASPADTSQSASHSPRQVARSADESGRDRSEIPAGRPDAGRTRSSAGEAGSGRDFNPPGDDELRLEALLQERARELEGERAERGRLQRLLREALDQIPLVAGVSVVGRAATDAGIAAERDRAVARALDAEAARAEAALSLDEAMGFLADGRGEEDGGLDVARLSGTARGLTSALAEMEEARDMAAARLTLVEHDMDTARERARGLERELAEARDALELKHVQMVGLEARGAGGGEDLRRHQAELESLRGELSGLRARGDEAENALRASLPREADLTRALSELRRELGAARAQLGAASSSQADSHERIEELERALGQLAERGHQHDQELTTAQAEALQYRDELSRARGEAENLRRSLAEAEDARSRREETLEAQRTAAQQGTAEQRRRVEQLREALRDTRSILADIDGTVRTAVRAAPGGGPGEGDWDGDAQTQPGVPVHIEDMEVLAERVAARDDRIRQLETQLSEANAARAAADQDHTGALNKVREKKNRLAADLEASARRLDAFEEVARGLRAISPGEALEPNQLAELFALLDA